MSLAPEQFTWAIGRVRPDPRNRDLFDDLPKEEADELKQSIAEYGQINPITVTPTGLIICGHQRYRAMKESGAKAIMVTVRSISDDDIDRLEELRREEQTKRRVLTPSQAFRMVRHFYETNHIEKGRGKGKIDYARNLFAEKTGISPAEQSQISKIADLIPPLMAIFEADRIPRTVAYQLAQLSSDEQKNLVETLGADAAAAMSLREATDYRKQLKERDDRVTALEAENAELRVELAGTDAGAEVLKQVAEARDLWQGNQDNLVLALEAERDVLRSALDEKQKLIEEKQEALDETKEALEQQISRVIGLESINAEAERLTRFKANNLIHKWLNESQCTLAVQADDYALRLKEDQMLATLLPFHRDNAIQAIAWLERYVRCIDESGDPPNRIRRMK